MGAREIFKIVIDNSQGDTLLAVGKLTKDLWWMCRSRKRQFARAVLIDMEELLNHLAAACPWLQVTERSRRDDIVLRLFIHCLVSQRVDGQLRDRIDCIRMLL